MSEKLGIAYCAVAATGELVYERRLERFGQVCASPVLAEGRLYYFDRSGSAIVLAARPELIEACLVNDPGRPTGGRFSQRPARTTGSFTTQRPIDSWP
jgi:hypothetical protein